MECYRFWYFGEPFHIQYGQIKTKDLYFEDWVWLVIRDVRELEYFSPNTHEFFVYPGKGLTDIYLERITYGTQEDNI